MIWAAALLGGYLLGAIPFGILIARALGLGDLRKIGSGNIGATNVLRTGHRGAALATLILDGGKGAAAVLLARPLVPEAAAIAGLGAFLGHLFPVWLGFRGGKGVATFLGTMLALSPAAGVACLATWLAVAVATRISSASALAAAALAPLWLMLFSGGTSVLAAVGMAALIYFAHRANIARLLAGTEPRISLGRK